METNSGLGGGAPKVNVQRRGWFRRFMAFVGPAYLVSIGYMDPGNWATDIEGGARFGYALLWVLLMSNLMALLLQTLASRLGIVTGYDLAQGCRREYPRALNALLWLFAEIAIAATDLAEVLGTIIGLQLLFGLPLLWGCAIAALDTFLLLIIQRFGVQKMEAFIVMMVGTIGACFFIEVFLAKPDWGGVVGGLVPSLPPSAVYVAIGIIGATVMPHNLYLHSSLVQSRAVANTLTGKREACKFNLLDTTIALNGAFLVNASIVIMAAADFWANGIVVTEIGEASQMLSRILGSQVAPVAFGIALLASGQSSTLTGTISGQVVMEGFLNIRLRPWLRRLVTRGVALAPAVIAIVLAGDKGIYQLLILSQVVLSLQLPFAVVPLIHFTSDRRKMGLFASPGWLKALAWLAAGVIISLNVYLVAQTLTGAMVGRPAWLWALVLAGIGVVGSVMAVVFLKPVLRPGPTWESGVMTAGRTVAAGIRPMQFRNIGVAVQHAEGDSEILSAALALAGQGQAKLTLVHVVVTPGTMLFGSASESKHGSEDEAYLEQLAREIEGLDRPVETMLRHGDPADEIVRSAEDAGFDLLVMGSHGHRGLGDIVFGQTVSRVRHTVRIPVMVVRSGGTEKPRPGLAPQDDAR